MGRQTGDLGTARNEGLALHVGVEAMRLLLTCGRFGFVSEELPIETVDLIVWESKKAPITLDGVKVMTIPVWVVENGLGGVYATAAAVLDRWSRVFVFAALCGFVGGLAAGFMWRV